MNGPALLRSIKLSVSAVVLGTLLAAGLALPAQAAETHSLTVTVRNVTGTPLVGMSVEAIAIEDGQQIEGEGGELPKATPVTGKPGVYVFSDLGDFDHTLYFGTATATTFAQLLGGESDLARAQVITADQTTLSVSLASNAVITGIVKNSAKKVLPKALVTAYYYTGSDWMTYSSTRADAKGRYYLRDIDPGSYRLRFDGAAGNVSPLYSGGSATWDGASAINVGVGVTTTVNATFPVKVGAITGTSRVYYAGYEEYGYVPLKSANAVAIPVTVDPNDPTERTIDLDRSVTSAAADKKGKWTIAGLQPGTYVVKVYPRYYNQEAYFIGSGGLAYARIFTVTAAKTITAPTSYTYQTDDGASLILNVGALGNSLSGADVLLQSDSDPDYFYRGTTDYIGNVTLGRSGAEHVIQPGSYTITVTTEAGTHAPYTKSISLYQGTNYDYITMSPAPQQPGFVTAPAIAETELAIGTRYVVAAQAKRGTATLSYQWLRDGRPIYGADEAAYTSRAGDISTQLTVRVSSYQFGYPVDSAVAAVAGLVISGGSIPTVVTPPTISPSSEAHVGNTLRVLPGTWSVPGLSFSYDWFRDGVPFANVTNSYVVTEGDLDAEFTVDVSTAKAGYGTSAVRTAAVTPVFSESVALKSGLAVKVAVVKKPKGTKKYSVAPGIWTALTPSLTYEWLRGGVVVGRGASLVEKPSKTYLAKTLEVRVTANAPGFGTGSVVRTARKGTVVLKATQLPTVRTATDAPVSGSTAVVVGQELVASSGTWIRGAEDVGTLTYSYQWLRKVGKAKVAAIAGAKLAGYTPKASDIGAVLTVKVTAASSRFGSATTTVAGGKVVATSELVGTVTSLTLPGKAIPLQAIAAPSVPAWTAASATLSYQWFGCALPACKATNATTTFTKIAKATGSQWVIPKIYANGRVFVAVTATKAGARSVRVDTPPITVSALNQLVVVGNPEIDTTFPVRIGNTVYGSWANFSIEATQTREWQVCLADCLTAEASWTAAGGLDNSSYFTPNSANWGTGESYLRIAETANRTGYLPVTAYSEPVTLNLGTISTFRKQVIQSQNTYTISEQWPYPAEITAVTQWFVGTELRSTGNSYTSTSADIGQKFYVVQTLSAVGYTDRELVSALASGPPVSIPARPTAIVGNTFGQEITLSDPVPWDLPQPPHANWVVTYTWHVGNRWGYSPTFVPKPEDAGKELTVSIKAVSPLYDAPYVYVQPVTIVAGAAPAPENPTALTWSGELLPGTKITSSTPTYALADVDTAYQWQSSADGGETWQNVAGATSTDYTVALIDSKRMLRLAVTSSKPGHIPSVATSAAAQVLEGNVIRQLGAPALSGTARVGNTLITTTGAWSEGAVPSIQWLLNGRAIPGATAATYVPLATHAGDEISVHVTARQAGKLDVSAETAALTIATGLAPVATKAPVITGTTTLTATPGVWNTSGLTYTFEWTRAGSETVLGETLVLPAGHLRAEYTLTVRATRFGYEPGTATAH